MPFVRLFLIAATLAVAAQASAQFKGFLVTASDGAASDLLGEAVSISDDTMVVGASESDPGGVSSKGAAYVYRWGGTSWLLEAKLTAGDGLANDDFGQAVSISGNTIVVGAPFADPNGLANAGAAYVFHRTGGAWSQIQKLVAPDGQSGDDFGAAVSTNGLWVAVGAPTDNGAAGSNQGSVYIYRLQEGQFAGPTKLEAAAAAASDEFGFAVSLDASGGATLAVGAPFFDGATFTNQGAAYIFRFISGAWTQEARVVAPDAATSDQLGASVALHGSTLLAGAPSQAGTGPGAAHVFYRSTPAWPRQARLQLPGAAAGDRVGAGVSLWGDNAAVGAPSFDSLGLSASGVVAMFHRTGAVWTEKDRVEIVGGAAASDSFGIAVGLGDQFIAIGASGRDVGANANQGAVVAAWSFDGQVESQVPVIGPPANTDNFRSLFGANAEALAADGDRMVVGAAGTNLGLELQGAAYVYRISAGVWSLEATLIPTVPRAHARFGQSVAIAGTVIAVGASEETVGGVVGAAYVFELVGGVWTQTARVTQCLTPAAGDASAYATDVATDGATLLVSMPLLDRGGHPDTGAVCVYAKSGGSWVSQGSLVDTARDYGYFGLSLWVSGNTARARGFANFGDLFTEFTRSGAVWSAGSRVRTTSVHDNAQYLAFDGTFILATTLTGNNGDTVAEIYERTGPTTTRIVYTSTPIAGSSDEVAISGSDAIAGRSILSKDAQGAWSVAGTTWQHDITAETYAVMGSSTIALGRVYRAGGDYFAIPGGRAGVILEATPWPQITVLASGAAPGNLSITGVLSALPSLRQWGAGAAARSSGVVDTVNGQFDLQVESAGWSFVPFNTTHILQNATTMSDLQVNGARTGDFLYGGSMVVPLRESAFITGLSGDFFLRRGGSIRLFPFSALDIESGSTRLGGAVRVDTGATLRATEDLNIAGDFTLLGGTLLGAGVIDFYATATFSGFGTLYVNDGATVGNAGNFITQADTQVVGNLLNVADAFINIRNGTLAVFGDFTNQGTVRGDVCCAAVGGLSATGRLVLSGTSSLFMPGAGGEIVLQGDADWAIDDHNRFDLRSAHVRIVGGAGSQTFEVMSADTGPVLSGLDRSLPGHFPLGTLSIIGPSVLTLVDSHDNDLAGQAQCEALYVDSLTIDAGATLVNPSCRVYYRTLDLRGAVTNPANLVPIAADCPADFTGDGFLDFFDFTAFVDCFEGLGCPPGRTADFNNDGFPDFFDFADFIDAFEAGC